MSRAVAEDQWGQYVFKKNKIQLHIGVSELRQLAQELLMRLCVVAFTRFLHSGCAEILNITTYMVGIL